MIKKIIKITAITWTAGMLSVHAANPDSCSIEVAVATPPVQEYEHVAFNASNEIGVNRALTLSGGSAPKTMEKLPCSNSPYIISATHYGFLDKQAKNAVGQCQLKAGAIVLSHLNSSVSVVFPNDFVC
ncbi:MULTISPECIES: hypothetical protein [Legionella]|uniref:Uncharacterized protein n=1 Tax=Legionella septentrionalis TaxID=2498109 RepID=A0A433JMI2_9GAMM|nr:MULTISPECIES: hypothetical protein [Legionella]MCP0913135.1 hypothetical protein [Legionella sp. 27cVA30]RUQ91584.1 hypothetical protein EKM59_00555 [Legionella septentrionalis]RUR02479.1 hypothetical protein ELY11_01770 [Legionella septentrionalis]RUR10634.1 hypothetical protein ELY14_04785 [Legionella septentrionalis]